MKYDMKKLEKIAKKTLSEKRFYHTQCVARRAVQLAKIYECDAQKAEAAAWLHDICKEQKQDEQLHWIEKFGIILDSIQLAQPKTWHGMAACGYIKFRLGINEAEIINAVRYHTTACANMSTLDEVVYLADLTSEERDYTDARKMHDLAEKGLAPAMKEAMRFAVCDLAKRSLCISADTLEAYNKYTAMGNKNSDLK